MGQPSAELVGFEDLGPTVLGLAGIDVPDHMQGRSFLARGVPAKPVQFAFRTNTGKHYAPNRTAFGGRFHYIRNYIPYKPLGLRQDYQWGVPAHAAWTDAFLDGSLAPEHAAFMLPRATEELYDTHADEWELHNLANDPAYAGDLLRLRAAVADHCRTTGDLGFFPRTTRAHGDTPLFDWVRDAGYDLPALIDLAESASFGRAQDVLRFIDALRRADDPATRFWGAAGLCTLAQRLAADTATAAPTDAHRDAAVHALTTALADANPEVRAAAAEALCHLGHTDAALPVLLADIRHAVSDDVRHTGFAASALESLGEAARPLVGDLRTMQSNQDVRSILINLGELPRDAYFTDEQYDEGRRANARRLDWTQPSPNP